jgi:hypothetical protein
MPDPTLTAAIWQRYEEDKPAPGRPYSAWVHRIAEESGTPVSVVRRIVAEGAGAMLNAINDRFQTFAQQISDFMGAGLVVALETLRDALTCNKRKVLLDHGGRPKLIDARPEKEGGPGYVPENMIYLEVPDWPSRLSAARTLIEIQGARPPQQVEVKSQSVVLNLSAHDARAELDRLAEALPRLQSALAGLSQAGSRVAGAGKTVEIAVGDQGRRLLDDGMHGDAR